MTAPVHTLPRGVVHVARAEAVYPQIEPGSVRLVISDGPYGMGKAAWDRQRGEDELREWYRPHVEAWGRVCMDAASVYVWGRDSSASALRPLMRDHGWRLRVRITWDRVVVRSMMRPGLWHDVTEVCDVYTRGNPPEHDVPVRSKPDSRGSRGKWGNVWRLHGAGAGSALARERLRIKGSATADKRRAEPLHPCQKPLAFYDRIIRASSDPGDLVLEPFGGTLRAAAACEALPPDEARRYICIEPDEDGRGYVPAALAAIQASINAARDAGAAK